MKINPSLLLTLLSLAILSAISLKAGGGIEYVWYNVIPEERRILISVERIEGKDVTDRFLESKEVRKEGKFSTYNWERGYSGRPEVLYFKEDLGGRIVETTITINHPRGMGMGGAVPSVRVEVLVDGIPRVYDMPLGLCHFRYISVPRIVVDLGHEMGSIRLMWFKDDIKMGNVSGESLLLIFGKTSTEHFAAVSGSDGARVAVNPDPPVKRE